MSMPDRARDLSPGSLVIEKYQYADICTGCDAHGYCTRMEGPQARSAATASPRDVLLFVGLHLVYVVRWLWPPYWFWAWFVRSWIVHDCDRQPILCRMEFLFDVPSWMWLDV